MLEPQEQTERDRRQAYLDGYKAGYENLYAIIANGVNRGAAYQSVYSFWNTHLAGWFNRARTEEEDAPRM